MDIHRCRFVPYQPSAINAVAFSHTRVKSAKQLALVRLAIGRANGDIEIWNPADGAWHQELVIRGGKDRSVDSLVWVNEPDQDLPDGRTIYGKSRLFSIGYTSTVTEWDLEKRKPKRHASGQHGDIWCMAAQPANPADPTQGVKLVAGTMDGELVMYSIEDDGLRFQRTLVKSATRKAQIVSITFQSRKVAVVGCSDGTIRAYDMSKGYMLRHMTIGSDVPGGAKDIIVWAVKCLPNGNIVSGDSTGHVCIWDGKTYTQSQKLASHKADVLSLAISADGLSIVSGGMDRRTVHHKQTSVSGSRWTKAWGRRYHDHDVKAMAAFEGGRISVIITGGPDTHPVVMPLKDLGKANHRTLPNLPLQPPLASAPKARFILSWWDRELHIWQLQTPAAAMFKRGNEKDLQQNRKLMKTIVVKGDSNITSATINEKGNLLFVSTATEVKAFRLRHDQPLKPADVQLSTLNMPKRIAERGASRLQLSPDGQWLSMIREGSRLIMARVMIETADGEDTLTVNTQKLARLHRDIPRYVINGGLGKYDRNVTHSCFSSDSKMFAVADLAGYTDTWTLNSATTNGKAQDPDDDESSSDSDASEDEEGAATTKKWRRNQNNFPKLPGSPTVLSFSSMSPATKGSSKQSQSPSDYTLLAITASWHILIFNANKGQLTEWARHNPRKALPGPIVDLADFAQGVVWQGQRIWVYGTNFLFMIDTSQNLVRSNEDAASAAQGHKRKRLGPSSGAGGKMAKGNLAPHKISRHTGDEEEDLDLADQDIEMNSDEEMDEVNGELSNLREGEVSTANTGTELAVKGGEKASWWITHKYRPILGIVPLSTKNSDNLEVALVERPAWDINIGEKYYAGEEWRR